MNGITTALAIGIISYGAGFYLIPKVKNPILVRVCSIVWIAGTVYIMANVLFQ